MKRLLHFIGNALTALTVIWDIIEFLAVPALLVIIGLISSIPWQYYAISIGAYIALFILAEIVAHFVLKAFDKKYTPIIERKFERLFAIFSKKG